MADKDKKLRVILKLPSKSGKAGASDSLKLESHKVPATTTGANARVSTPPKKRKFKTLVEGDARDDSISTTPVFKAPLPPPAKKPFQKKKEKPLNGVIEAPLASPERGHGAATAPAKKVLEGVLDKLKKKDTYGVFSEPVDAKLVPDYYDVIKEPMDFGTMYKKISKGVYCTLIPFEKDIMLICNNAMRYNGPVTIYYKQARSIQDAARKALDALAGQSGALEVGNAKLVPQKNPAKKGGKNTAGVKTLLEPASSDVASGASLAAERDDPLKPNEPDAVSIRREPPSSDRSGGAAGDEAGNGVQSNLEPDAEVQDDHGAQLKPAALKDGRKPLSTDENHRTSYKLRNLPAHGRGPLAGVGGEFHHLVPTGYQSEMAYAKSLCRFSARLGAEGWRFAAHRLQRVLAPSVPFGQGWIGEHEAPPGTIFKKFPPDVKPTARINPSLVPTTFLPPITTASLGPIIPLPLMMTPLAQTAMDSLLTTVTSAMLASQASTMEISTENSEHSSRGQGTPSTSDVSTIGRPLWSTVSTSGMVMQASSDVSGWPGSTSQGAPTFVYSIVPSTSASNGEEVHTDLVDAAAAAAMARANVHISPAPRPSQYMLPKPVPSFGSSLVWTPTSSSSTSMAPPQQLATATTPQPLQNGDSRPPDLQQPVVDSANQLKTLG